jgi:hypothetical protein
LPRVAVVRPRRVAWSSGVRLHDRLDDATPVATRCNEIRHPPIPPMWSLAMTLRILVAACLLGSSFVASAAVGERDADASLSERAEENAEQISDAEAFLDEIDDAIEAARAGDYGRLKKGTIVRIEMARNRIGDLLAGHDSALELKPDERIELFNAQETITAAIRSDDKNREVCKREMVTGSRLPKTECMTVAEREARRRNAQENTDKFLRNLCTVGEGNDCAF